MRKVNWVKVPRNRVVQHATLWRAPSTDLKVDIEPGQVEELFARVEVTKKEKKEEETKKGPTMVCCHGAQCCLLP